MAARSASLDFVRRSSAPIRVLSTSTRAIPRAHTPMASSTSLASLASRPALARARRAGPARASAARASAEAAPSPSPSSSSSAALPVSRRAGLASLALAPALVAAGRASAYAPSAAPGVVELTPENFAAEVESPGSGAVFVEFYAPWCPFCQKLEPIWNDLPARLADENVPTKIARMNVDTYVEYGAAYGVTGFPTLMLFKDGAPVGQKTGLVTAEQALKYARLSDGGDPRSVAAMGPKPALNLVLTGAQVDDALAELEAIERDLDVGGLAGAEREDAERRVKALRAIFAKRSL